MYLLDTCALLWLGLEEDRLSEIARGALAEDDTAIYVSAISGFEVGLQVQKGRIDLPANPMDWISGIMEHHGIREIPIDVELAMASTALPEIHQDPADRIIIATALATELQIVTPDRLIRRYPDIRVLW